MPLGIEDSFFMGKLAERGVERTRVASIEYTFKPPSFQGDEGGDKEEDEDEDEEFADDDDIVGTDDVTIAGLEGEECDKQKEGGAAGDVPRGLLGMMASALKETDPEEAAGVADLAWKLRGREYFFDPRMFNNDEVRMAGPPHVARQVSARGSW